MLKRDLCPVCNIEPVAVNYIRDSVYHYRNSCASCIRKGKKIKTVPLWAKSGYKKKPQCELCGFKFKLASQNVVYHIDGNLKNVVWTNLKTVCLNCQQELVKMKVTWKSSPIVPDF